MHEMVGRLTTAVLGHEAHIPPDIDSSSHSGKLLNELVNHTESVDGTERTPCRTPPLFPGAASHQRH